MYDRYYRLKIVLACCGIALLIGVGFVPLKTVETQELVTTYETVTVQEPYTVTESYTEIVPRKSTLSKELADTVYERPVGIKYELENKTNPLIHGEWHRNSYYSALALLVLSPAEYGNWNAAKGYSAYWQGCADDGEFNFNAPVGSKLYLILWDPLSTRVQRTDIADYDATISCYITWDTEVGYDSITKTRQVLKYREVTKQAEKQEVVITVDKLSFWEYIFQ